MNEDKINWILGIFSILIIIGVVIIANIPDFFEVQCNKFEGKIYNPLVLNGSCSAFQPNCNLYCCFNNRNSCVNYYDWRGF